MSGHRDIADPDGRAGAESAATPAAASERADCAEPTDGVERAEGAEPAEAASPVAERTDHRDAPATLDVAADAADAAGAVDAMDADARATVASDLPADATAPTAAVPATAREPLAPPTPDPEPPAAAVHVVSPGTRLRERREARGLGLAQITESLHIEPRLVAAMEADDFAAFDAPVYARGFLRKYAAFLELPPDEIAAEYDALHRGPGTPTLIPPATATEAPRDWSAFRVPAVAALVVAVVGGSYWWWLTRAPESAPAGPSVAIESSADPGNAVAALGAPAPAAALDASASGAVPAVAGTADASTAAGGALAVAPAPPSRAAAPGILEFRFAADCWIEVYGPAGERLLFDLARAGETRAVTGTGPWRVFVGFADGVRVSVGGRNVPIPPERRRGSTARFAIAPDGSAQ